MKTIITKIMGLLFIATSISSCSKDSDYCNPVDEESPCFEGIKPGAKLLLAEYRINGKIIGKFEYDDQNRMIRNLPYGSDGMNEISISYLYDNRGRLSAAMHTKVNGEVDILEEYAYSNGNEPVSMTQKHPDRPGLSVIDWEFTYDNNRLINETAVSRENEPQILTVDYTYDNSGNLLSWEQKSNGLWLATFEFGDYDDQVAISTYGYPYRWKGIHSGLNNHQFEKVTSLNSAANHNLTIEYMYNDAGYPVKAKVNNKGTDVPVETREYIYMTAH